MYVQGISTTLAGGIGSAVLPNTGGYKPFFYTAVALVVIGVATLAVSGIVSMKQRTSR